MEQFLIFKVNDASKLNTVCIGIDKKIGSNQIIVPLTKEVKVVNTSIKDAISGIIDIILPSEKDDINLDLDDLKTVVNHKGVSVMSIGKYEGEAAAYEAVKQSIDHMLLQHITLSKAKGALINFYLHSDYPTQEIENAIDMIYNSMHEDADIIFGTTIANSFSKRYVQATVILSGFEIFEDEIFQFTNLILRKNNESIC